MFVSYPDVSGNYMVPVNMDHVIVFKRVGQSIIFYTTSPSMKVIEWRPGSDQVINDALGHVEDCVGLCPVEPVREDFGASSQDAVSRMLDIPDQEEDSVETEIPDVTEHE